MRRVVALLIATAAVIAGCSTDSGTPDAASSQSTLPSVDSADEAFADGGESLDSDATTGSTGDTVAPSDAPIDPTPEAGASERTLNNPEPSPLATLLGTYISYEDGARSDPPPRTISPQAQAQIDERITRCMRAEGFSEVEFPAQPTDDYPAPADLSPAEAQAYWLAMNGWGAGAGVVINDSMTDEDVEQTLQKQALEEPSGCLGKARWEVLGVPEYERGVLFAEAFEEELNEVLQRARSDPRLIEAEKNRDRCLKENGYQDLDELQAAIDAVVEPSDDGSQSDPVSIDAGIATELEAMFDVNDLCVHEARRVQVEALHDAEQDFIEHNQQRLAAFNESMNSPNG